MPKGCFNWVWIFWFCLLQKSISVLLGPQQVIASFLLFFFSSRKSSLVLTVGGNAAPVLGTGGMLMKGSYKFDVDEPFTC